jgi:hypothetical protein
MQGHHTGRGPLEIKGTGDPPAARCDIVRVAMDSPNHVTRRSFLVSTAALPVALAAQQGSSIPIGLELYSVRDNLAKDLPGTLQAVGKMGYQVVEFYAPYIYVDAGPRQGSPRHPRWHRHALQLDAQWTGLLLGRRASRTPLN